MAFESEINRALRKGRLRIDSLLALYEKGEMHLERLAEACRTEARMVFGALQGRPPKFKIAFGLVRLGLVRWIWRPSGWSVALTPLGEKYAAMLHAGWRP